MITWGALLGTEKQSDRHPSHPSAGAHSEFRAESPGQEDKPPTQSGKG